ncbi:hypothetical protein DVH24_027537 [Malus domestica]|uniref:RNase H type-1 domain-containing protein n=1 Tax=Malus domestica TaxID=3750 RepID=A0A498H989_MALDO|nr:hypothetical protein DVH24_027537 [Malus domestica]
MLGETLSDIVFEALPLSSNLIDYFSKSVSDSPCCFTSFQEGKELKFDNDTLLPSQIKEKDMASHFIHKERRKCHHNRGLTTEHIVASLAPPAGDFWCLHVDISSNYQGSRVGLVLNTLGDSMLEQAISLSFMTLNNEAEYEALLAGLRLANNLAVKKLVIYSDS